MNYTKEIEEVMISEKVYVSDQPGHEAGWLPAIQRAAARINELVQPVWYYPSKGELPDNHQRVWICHNGKSYVAQYVNDELRKMLFESYTRNYPVEEVAAWTPYIVPTPPVEKEVSRDEILSWLPDGWKAVDTPDDDILHFRSNRLEYIVVGPEGIFYYEDHRCSVYQHAYPPITKEALQSIIYHK